MKLSFWRKTMALLMAALLALSAPVLAFSETVETAATAEPTAVLAAVETPVVPEAPVEAEATEAPVATEIPAVTEAPVETEATETPVADEVLDASETPADEATPVPEPANPSAANLASEQLIFHCTTDAAHVDQVSNGGSYYKFKTGTKTYDETRGVWTATMNVTNIQTLLTFGTSCPDKVWGRKHYHTDDSGNTVRTATVTVVWNAETGKWEPDGGAYVINVWHATQPSQPKLPTSGSTGSTRAITVKDSSNPSSEKLTYFRYLKSGTYSFGEVTKGEDGNFWCDMTITDLDYYVQEFNSVKNVSYRIDTTADNSTFVYKFKYTVSSTATDFKQDGTGWTIDASSYDKAKGETVKAGKTLYVADLCTVTYTDGVGGAAFATQSYDVKPGSATPAFDGTPTRANYTFAGWQPEVAEIATGDVTYTAQWTLAQPAKPSGTNSVKQLFKFHCTTTPEEHVDQTYNWFGSFVQYNNDMAWDEARGVYTATAKITNVASMLSAGVNCPEKVWGCTHYHTDADGKKLMTATIKLVWDPDAVGPNAAGTETYGLWLPDGEQLVNVWHATQPTPPVLSLMTPKSQRTSTAIRVRDTNGKLKDSVTYFRYLKEGTYTLSEITKDEKGDFWCDLTITNLDYYVNEFNTSNKVSYKIDNAKTTTSFVFKLRYAGSKVNYTQDGSNWTVDNSTWLNGEKSAGADGGKIVYVGQPYTITYTDGVNGEAFADQKHEVVQGNPTPAFDGTPTRAHYTFAGWQPEVAETVTGDATYTAQWTPEKPRAATNVLYGDSFRFHCTTDESHEDTSYWLSTYVDFVSDSMKQGDDGVWTAQMRISSVQTQLYFGPDKTWGRTHYYTDKDGNTVRTYTFSVHFDPNATGKNYKGETIYGWWVLDEEVVLNVWCNTKPAVPKAEKLSGNLLWLRDSENTKNWQRYTVANAIKLPSVTYSISEMTQDADGNYWSELTITDLAPYVDAFQAKYGSDAKVYELDSEKNLATYTFKLKYTGSTTDYKQDGSGWKIIYDSKSEEWNGKQVWVTAAGFATVTYTDGADGSVFADQVYDHVKNGSATPAFQGDAPARKGYVFMGWQPAVAETVDGDATYTADWAVDKNGNGIPDKEEEHYTVTYTDGAKGEAFADQTYSELVIDEETPAFEGTPTRKGYVFAGWQPEVARTVSGDATYTALWTVDKNGNGIPDDQEEHFTVTYTDGTKKHTAFADQVFTGLVKGEDTPAFDGKPTRKGYKFLGWKPEVEKTVSGNTTYTAQWAKIEAADEDEVPKTGDTSTSSMTAMLMSLTCMGLAVMLLLARSKAQKNH